MQRVVTIATDQRVGAEPTGQCVVAVATIEEIGECRAGEVVGAAQAIDVDTSSLTGGVERIVAGIALGPFDCRRSHVQIDRGAGLYNRRIEACPAGNADVLAVDQQGVVTIAADQRVRTRAAVQNIVAIAAVEEVGEGRAGEAVGTAQAIDKHSGALAGGVEDVIAGITLGPFDGRRSHVQGDRRAGLHDRRIEAGAARDADIGTVDLQRVVTIAADQRVGARAAGQRVVAVAAIEEIGKGRAGEVVGATQAIDEHSGGLAGGVEDVITGVALHPFDGRRSHIQVNRRDGLDDRRVEAGAARDADIGTVDLQRVVTIAADQRVGARAAGQRVVAVAAVEEVSEVRAGEVVGAAQAVDEDSGGLAGGVEGVIADIALGPFDCRRSHIQGDCGACLHDRRIEAGAAGDADIGTVDLHRVVTIATDQRVGAEPTGQRVVAVAAVEEVGEVRAGKVVGAAQAVDEDAGGLASGVERIVAGIALGPFDGRRSHIQVDRSDGLHDHRVEAGTAGDADIGTVDLQGIVTIATDQRVGAEPAGQRVVAVAAVEEVGEGRASEAVGAAQAVYLDSADLAGGIEDVVAGITLHPFDRGCAHIQRHGCDGLYDRRVEPRAAGDADILAVDQQRVVAIATDQGVGAGSSIQDIVAGIADDGVVARVADAIDVARVGEGEILQVVAQREADRRLHRVSACAPILGDGVAGIVDDIGVVTGTAGHRVRSGSAVEDIAAEVAGDRIVCAVPRAIDIRAAGQRQVLEIVA